MGIKHTHHVCREEDVMVRRRYQEQTVDRGIGSWTGNGHASRPCDWCRRTGTQGICRRTCDLADDRGVGRIEYVCAGGQPAHEGEDRTGRAAIFFDKRMSNNTIPMPVAIWRRRIRGWHASVAGINNGLKGGQRSAPVSFNQVYNKAQFLRMVGLRRWKTSPSGRL